MLGWPAGEIALLQAHFRNEYEDWQRREDRREWERDKAEAKRGRH